MDAEFLSASQAAAFRAMTTDRNDDDKDKRERGPFVGCMAVALIFALPAYVLSIGPVAWLHNHGYLPHNVGMIYLPLGLLAQICPPFGEALNWYEMLWRG